MNERIQKLEALFHDALKLPACDRRAFLKGACDGDPDLLREAESLLEHHSQRTGAFEAAIQQVASDLQNTILIGPESAPGAMLGPYRLDRKLGEGGMGTVYLGSDTRLGRRVAVKVISRALARSAEARTRFLREARSAAALSHVNIAAIHDVGESGETPWLVMEYIEGDSMRSAMTRPLGEGAWLQYASQVAAALAHAHARHIIHRDIKPENILVDRDDQIKVIDFGLSRAVHDQTSAAGTITGPNTFVGTIAYAAPELFAGGGASTRSDVYSAGVLFYEMACGEHPFARLTGHSLVSAIAGGSYRACRSHNPRISPGIEAFIHRAMSREPAARYKDGADLVAALQNLDAAQGNDMTGSAAPTLAVIEFQNIGGSSEFDWLGTGIAETLSADLAKVRSVRIASRSRVVQSVRRLGRPENDATAAIEIGCDLGARWIVTGGYQKVGDRVRVTTTLIDTSSGEALAAEKIDGQWADLFDVQDRVAEVVLKLLTLRFETSDRERILPPETRNMAAYEHYARARQQMYGMQTKSLAAAILHFEHAVRLDPDYALAYSGLGTAHALQFIHTSNPEDIQRASAYLERAIELDAELGEPYPWLANIRLRKNDPEGCLAAGRKGIELQPDLPMAQYFYAGVFYMVPEVRPGALRTGLPHQAEAIRLEPRLHAAWLVMGASVLFLGKHVEAIRILTEAVRMEGQLDLIYPFVGARTLLAFAHARAGSWSAARAKHLESLEALRDSDHIYASSFATLSVCGLGEIEFRTGNENDALTYFRRARRMIGESRRTAGSARILMRINAGLAAAYAGTGDMARARELTGEVAAQLGSLAGQTATATFECSFGQLWLNLACAEIRLGDMDAAAACLMRARECGWLDAAWLRIDPELQALVGHPVFDEFVQSLDSAQDTPIPPLSYGLGPGSESASGTT